jgi:uncharacterized membrane protein YkvA (DUF1232 family)
MSTPRGNSKFLAILAAIVSVIYLINPGAGFIELIPDNIPFVGNLDEAGATALLIWAINQMRAGSANVPPPPRDVTPPQ